MEDAVALSEAFKELTVSHSATARIRSLTRFRGPRRHHRSRDCARSGTSEVVVFQL